MDSKKSAAKDPAPEAGPEAVPGAAPAAAGAAAGAFERLIRIMARLRDPDSGCPWDVEQTFATIAPCTIEEAYEVADAIERNDLNGLRDELGDLLLQVVFHARMAEEQNAFDAAAVCEAISDKMVRRHPHVFGPGREASGIHSAQDQTGAWEAQKAQERAAGAAASGGAGAPAGALDGIAANLPALTRALKLQKRAARVGFDWPDMASTRAKLDEEIGELDAEIAEIAAGPNAEARDRAAEELGDVLFSIVNVARKLDLDADAALRAANTKFERRFAVMEAGLRAAGQTPETAPLDEMERRWQGAKNSEKD